MKETIVKINKIKNWFFEKINKIDIQPDSSRKKERRIKKNRNEKRKITTDNEEIQRIIRGYYEEQYANKMDNLKEMDLFLEKFNLSRLNQEEIETMNKPITYN